MVSFDWLSFVERYSRLSFLAEYYPDFLLLLMSDLIPAQL